MICQINISKSQCAIDDALDDLDRAIQMLALADDALKRPDDQSLQAARWLVQRVAGVLDLDVRTDLAHV